MRNNQWPIIRPLSQYVRYTVVMMSLMTMSLLSLTPATTVFAAEKRFTCTPADVFVFQSRLHVKCSPGDGSITFFALGFGNNNHANRILSILSTALVAKRSLSILYDPVDLDGVNLGCLKIDCRLIRGVGMF
jgi:hypothetical protein